MMTVYQPDDFLPCDHCDGECTEVVVGEYGYENGPCSRCDATGYVHAELVAS